MIGPECGSTKPGAPTCVTFFFSTGLRLPEALSGSRSAELTIQQPGRDNGYDEHLGGLHYEH